MDEGQQFAIVLQRIRLIAETEYNNELESNVIEIFNKLSQVEQLVLMKRFVKTHFSKDIVIQGLKSTDVVDAERDDIINQSTEENSLLRVFIIKSVFVFALVILGFTFLIGGSSLIDSVKNAYDVVKIMIG